MSKFSGLRGARDSAAQVEPVDMPAPPELSRTQKSSNAGTKAMGRPRAKRSDPDYTQVTAYIRKDTHMTVKRKLLDMGDAEFSDIVEKLLSEWAKRTT